MRLLHKITILTLLYQFTGFFYIASIGIVSLNIYRNFIIPNFMGNLISFTMSYSMYLMMDHNQAQYFKFLRCIRCLRIHWMCCKWRYIVTDPLNELDPKGGEENDIKVASRSSDGVTNETYMERKLETNETNGEKSNANLHQDLVRNYAVHSDLSTHTQCVAKYDHMDSMEHQLDIINKDVVGPNGKDCLHK